MDDQITLTTYAEQARELIHKNQNDEAIAICKHLLSHYPRYVDAYRQLGEAYLEQGDLDHAKEMFQRVLSCDPENVIAYVGLASVCDQQQLIAEAVWHLERAFELNPGNQELGKELLRLYAESEGKPRPRLKLTSGALARTYAREGLYAQAIQEFRALTTVSPARLDSRVALAETLWRAGRIHEAAEVAQALLEPLPYCLKANLILGTAWKEAGLSESETYLQRAQSLDPMNQTAQHLFGFKSPLTPMRVTVPPYSKPQAVPVASEFGTETSEFPETVLPSEISAAPFSFEITEEKTAESEPTTSVESALKPDITDTTLPPWLRAQGTASVSETPDLITLPKEQPARITPTQLPAEPEPTGEENLPAWLMDKLVTAEPSQPLVAESVEGEPPKTTAPFPSWIRDLQPPAAFVAEKTIAEEKPGTPPVEQAETSSWLRDLQTPSAPPQEPSAPAETPIAKESAGLAEPTLSWLHDLQTPSAPPQEPSAPAEIPATEEPARSAEPTLSWLHDLQVPSAPPQEPSAPAEIPVTEEPARSAEPTLSWLHDLQVQSAPPQEPSAPAEVPATEEPARSAEPTLSWLHDLQVQSAPPQEPSAPAEILATEEPAELTGAAPSWLRDLQSSPAPSEETSAPVKSFAAVPVPAPEEQVEPAEATLAWLREFQEEALLAELKEETATAPALPAFLGEIAETILSEEGPAPLSELQVLPKWLSDLQRQTIAASQAVELEEQPTPIEELLVTVPRIAETEPKVTEEIAPVVEAETKAREEVAPISEVKVQTIEPVASIVEAKPESPAETKPSVEAQSVPREKIAPAMPLVTQVAVPSTIIETAQVSKPTRARTTKPKRAPKGTERLAKARELRDANRIPEALVEYDALVQHSPRLVRQVIVDLEALTKQLDLPLEAHRILGDAYTRTDRLAEALERYRFVLEHAK